MAPKPSMGPQLAAGMASDTWGYLRYYSSLRDRLSEIESVADAGENDGGIALLGQALDLCRPHFPPGTDFAPPPVSVVVLKDRDGRGYVPVIMDVSWWLDYRRDLVYILAHESFHYLHSNIMRFRYEDTQPADEDIFWVIKQTQFEGIADQVGGPLHTPFSMYSRADVEDYARRVEEQASFVPVLDEALRRVAAEPTAARVAGSEVRRRLVSSGHLLGDYMADCVIEASGAEALRHDMGNPFTFFRAYNQAAARLGKPVYSEGALETLRRLERMYIR